MQRYLHLDSEYRARFEHYHLSDGRIFDSRKVYWRQIEWEKVIKIDVYIRDQKHSVTCENKPNFKGMMRFRWAGSRVKQDVCGNRIESTKINIWTIGWTDGVDCHLTDIDFKTGYKLRSYTEKLRHFTTHVHPRLKLAKWIHKPEDLDKLII